MFVLLHMAYSAITTCFFCNVIVHLCKLYLSIVYFDCYCWAVGLLLMCTFLIAVSTRDRQTSIQLYWDAAYFTVGSSSKYEVFYSKLILCLCCMHGIIYVYLCHNLHLEYLALDAGWKDLFADIVHATVVHLIGMSMCSKTGVCVHCVDHHSTLLLFCNIYFIIFCSISERFYCRRLGSIN